jgi:pimeloyl-ACP methyl ester carboxylesterase
MRRAILALLLAAMAFPGRAETNCKAAPSGGFVEAGQGVRVHVRTIGAGRPVLFIPSLARGVADFDEVATRLGEHGFLAILPDPRGAGETTGPAPASLFDLAHDAQAVAESLCDGPVDVVGHAFGNRVARALATSAPKAVRNVVLLAGGGKARPLPQVGNSVALAASEGQFPEEKRLQALQTAFFASGHDARAWLTGWSIQARDYQGLAGRGSSVEQWWKGGAAPILLVQAEEDPVAPAGNAEDLRKDIGDRLTLVTLRRASHAILPEQPEAVVWLLERYLSGERNEAALQQGSDLRIRP